MARVWRLPRFSARLIGWLALAVLLASLLPTWLAAGATLAMPACHTLDAPALDASTPPHTGHAPNALKPGGGSPHSLAAPCCQPWLPPLAIGLCLLLALTSRLTPQRRVRFTSRSEPPLHKPPRAIYAPA